MTTVDKNSDDVYICIKCNKNYKDRTGLWRHNHKYHTLSDHITYTSCIQNAKSSIQNVHIVTTNENIICKYCNKNFYNRQSRWRHEKTCKEKQHIEEIVYKNTIQELLDKQKKIESEIEKLKRKPRNKIINFLRCRFQRINNV